MKKNAKSAKKGLIFFLLLIIYLFCPPFSLIMAAPCSQTNFDCDPPKEGVWTVKGKPCPDPRCIKETPIPTCGQRQVIYEQCCCEPGVLPAPGSRNCGDGCGGPNDNTCPASCPCISVGGGQINYRCGDPALIPEPGCDICGCPQPGATIQCLKCDSDCQNCVANLNSWSALGCIPTSNFNSFTAWFLGRLISIAGGIAFLLVIFGGFKLMTSAGDPKGVQAAKEKITSALIGLLFIIFSIFLLELIGVRILGIPGL